MYLAFSTASHSYFQITACSCGQTVTTKGLSLSHRLTRFLSWAALLLNPPVKVKFVGQHPPVIAPGLWCVQAATQLLSNGDRDAEGIGPDQCGDVAGGVQQRGVNALGILQEERGRDSLKERQRI